MGKIRKVINMKTFILIALPIIFGITGQLLLKTGLMQIGKFQIMNSNLIVQYTKIFMNPYVFIGFLCYAVASIVWIITLTRVPLSFAYPMLSINYVGVILGAKYIFGEDINVYRWIGIGIICIGVAFIGRS
jgi:drug/metabolite transporter (DMT)-like permease